MRFYKVFLVPVLMVVSALSIAEENRMSPQEAMEMAKKNGWLDGITQEGEMQKTQVFRKDLEGVTSQQSDKVIAETSKTYFQNLKQGESEADDVGPHQQGTPNYKPDESQVKIDLDIFVSLSMPDSSLKKALAIASKKGARILIQGLEPKSKSIMPVIRKLKALSKNIVPEPLVQLDPVKYKKYDVTNVPVLIYREDGHEFIVDGTLATDWLVSRASEQDESKYFGVMGQMFKVEEINIIDYAEQQNAAIDWDKQKKDAIERFWKIKPFEVLPEVDKSDVFYMDPTITVTKDIVNLNGDVIAHKGTVVNPAADLPYELKVIVFDSLKPKQVAWALEQAEKLKEQMVVIVSTRFDRNDGWKHLESVRKRFGREVKLLNKAMVDTFGLVSSPAMIETENSYIKVSQIGRQELSEYELNTESTGE